MIDFRIGTTFLAVALSLGFTAATLHGQDDRANDIVTQVSESYGTLTSYYSRGTMTMSVRIEGIAAQDLVMDFVLARVEPDRRRLEIRHPTMGLANVTNGESTWRYSQSLNQYTREAFVPRPVKGEGLSEETGSRFAGLEGVLEKYRALATHGVRAQMVGEEELASDGRTDPCYVLTVDFPSPVPLDAETLPDTLWIDAREYLVRREVRTKRQAGRPGPMQVTHTLTFHDIRVNESLPDSLFAFTPPRGAREVDDLAGDARPRVDLTGQDASDFRLVDLRGKRFSLEKLRGKVVLLNFWATWCAPCRSELPHLEKLHNEFASRGLVVLGVNSESPDRAGKFMRESHYSFPSLVDPGGKVADLYSVGGLPTVVVIDRGGKIASYILGVSSEQELRDALITAGISGEN